MLIIRTNLDEDEKDRQMELMTTDFIPLEPVVMSFWEKFLELQIRMLFISNENVQNHMYTSSPWEWLTLTRGIAYWVSPDSNVRELVKYFYEIIVRHGTIKCRLKSICSAMSSFGSQLLWPWRFTAVF